MKNKNIEAAKDKLNHLSWLDGDCIRPYIFVRKDNEVKNPGTLFDSDWFSLETHSHRPP